MPEPALAPVASPVRMTAARQRGVLAQQRWRKRAEVAALAKMLDGISPDAPASPAWLADQCRPWLADTRWLDALVHETAAAICEDPFAAFAFAPVSSRTVQGVAILQAPWADVSLCWVDARMLADVRDDTLLFCDIQSVVAVVRSGGLTVQSHRLADTDGRAPTLHSDPPRVLDDGEVLLIDSRHEALSMRCAPADAVLLRISRTLPDPAPSRSVDAASGLMLGTVMAEDRVARMLPLLSVPRLAGQAARAAAMLADLSSDGDPVLRWAAIREWLVADTCQAVAALPAIAAGDPDADVRAAAAATLAMLAPAQTERSPCPA